MNLRVIRKSKNSNFVHLLAVAPWPLPGATTCSYALILMALSFCYMDNSWMDGKYFI